MLWRISLSAMESNRAARWLCFCDDGVLARSDYAIGGCAEAGIYLKHSFANRCFEGLLCVVLATIELTVSTAQLAGDAVRLDSCRCAEGVVSEFTRVATVFMRCQLSKNEV